MNSRQALENIIFDAKMEKPIFSRYYQEFLKPIEKDLDRLEQLEKENKELKEKVNHFEKVIEDIKNLPDCDFKKTLINNNFKYMFSNCKLTKLPELEELENDK